MRRVVVTGASRGLGRELAIRLAGPDVLMAIVARSAEGLAATADSLTKKGAQTPLQIVSDLSIGNQCKEVFERCEAEFGGADILINNAAVWEGARFINADPEEFAGTVSVNLVAPMLLSHYFSKGMVERGGGHLFFIGSTASFLCAGYSAAYTASKAGLLGLARTIRTQLRSQGIRVTTILPGSIASDMADATVNDVRIRHGGRRIPMDDIASLVETILGISDMSLVEELYVPAMMDRFGD